MNEDKIINLTIEELEYVQSEVENKGKKLPLTYVLALILGWLGVHRAYLGKTKTAIVRAVTSLATALTAVAMMANEDIVNVSIESLTMQDRTYSSMMMTLFLGLVIIGFLWTIYDLYLIPKWIKEDIASIEENATEDAIKARHFSEHLRKELLSRTLVEDITNDVTEKVTSKLEETINETYDKITVSTSNIKDDYSKLEKSSEAHRNNAESIYSTLLERISKSEVEIREMYDNLEVSLHRALVRLDSELMKEFLSEDLEIISLSADKENVIEANTKTLIPEAISDENNLETIPEELSTIINTDDSLPESPKESKKSTEVVSVAQAIKNNQGYKSVKGYIVGYVDPNNRTVVKEDIDKDTNIVIADYPSEANQDVMLAIKLSWDSGLREKLGLGSNSDNYNKSIVISGQLDEYFGQPGMTEVDKAYFL